MREKAETQTNLSTSPIVKKIVWKHRNKTYIFYITKIERDFFNLNFTTKRLMYFYLYLKYISKNTRVFYVNIKDLNIFDNDLGDFRKNILPLLKKANLINAEFDFYKNKWKITLNNESDFNMFSTDLAVTNYIKKQYKDRLFNIPHGYYAFVKYTNGVLKFQDNHKYPLSKIVGKTIDKAPSQNLINALRISLDRRKIKVNYFKKFA